MAVLLDRIVGHEQQLQALKAFFSKDPVGRTFLFSGPSGVGKKQVAWGVAQALLCEKKADLMQACGECGSCHRIEQKSHESLLWIDPESEYIKTEEARGILNFLQLKALSKYRFIIVDQAHRLNLAAGNSLLKIMEEPPEDVFFFLITSSPTQVLQTLRSRSMKIPFQSLNAEDLKEITGAPSWMAESSRGRVDLLKEKMKTEDQELKRKWAHEFKYVLTSNESWVDVDWRAEVKEKGTWPDRLQFWQNLVRDLLLLKYKAGSSLIYPELKDITETLSPWSVEKIDSLFQKLLSYERDLHFHRDSVLMVEEMMARYGSPMDQRKSE